MGNLGSRNSGPCQESAGGNRSSRRRVVGHPDGGFRGGSRRKRGQKIGRARRPAGARVLEHVCSHVARVRADAEIQDVGESDHGGGGGGQPGSFRRRVVGRPDRVFRRWLRARTGPGKRPFAPTGVGPSFRTNLRRSRADAITQAFGRHFRGGSESRTTAPRRGCMGGGLRVFGGASSDVPTAGVRSGSGRRRGPKIDHSRLPAGTQVLRKYCAQVARFRAHA